MKCSRQKVQFAIKVYCSLLALMMGKLIEANRPKLTFQDTGNLTPALFFVENPKYRQFYIVPKQKYNEDDIEKRKEILVYTCPASQDEINEMKDSNLSKKIHPAARVSAASQIVATTKADVTDSESSNLSPPKNNSDSDEEDSWVSDGEDVPIQQLSLVDDEKEKIRSSLDNNGAGKKPIYDDDYFFDLGEILDKLASKAQRKDIRWATNRYFCQNDFKPQKAKVDDCARLINQNEYEGAKLYSISYRVKMIENREETGERELFVYAKCFKYSSQETLYVMYKIIPPVSAEEPEQIDYETFDPTKIYPDYVCDPYLLNEQKHLLKELNDKIKNDDVIPQRLIPVYSIAEDYAKGTVTNDGDIFRPQWRSKAKIWDNLSRQIFNHGKKLKWIIYTGTVGTLSTSNGRPMEIKRKKIPVGLSIPLYWWTLILKTDGKGEGIIIGILNYPKTVNPKPPKHINKLCNTTKTCADLGWGDIINETNVDYVVCCEVNGPTTSSLIAYPLELNILSLDTEKTIEEEQNRVRVDNLTNELFSIRKKYLKWKDKNVAESPDSPVSTPSSPNRENSESPNTTPLDSPDRQGKISSPRSSHEANEFSTKSKLKSRLSRFLNSPISNTKFMVSTVRSPMVT